MTGEAPKLRVVEGGGADGPPPEEEERTKRFVPVVPPPEEPFFSGALGVGLVLASIAFAGLAWLATRPPPPPAPEDQIVEFVVIEDEPEPEPEEPEPEPEPEPTPPPPPEPKVANLEQPPDPVPTEVATEPIPDDAPPPKPVFGVSMDSTVSSNSGLSVRVGNTIGVKPTDEVVAPEEVQPLRKVSFAKLETPPKLIRDFVYPQSDYPPDALAEGIQGQVTLKLTIDENGDVSNVKLMRGVHPSLDDLAIKACYKFKFKPGMSGGEAVITQGYIHRYNWVIVD